MLAVEFIIVPCNVFALCLSNTYKQKISCLLRRFVMAKRKFDRGTKIGSIVFFARDNFKKTNKSSDYTNIWKYIQYIIKTYENI